MDISVPMELLGKGLIGWVAVLLVLITITKDHL